MTDRADLITSPLSWDDVFGDLDVRTLDEDERLDLINRKIHDALEGKLWVAKSAGEEGDLAWDAAVRTFVDGIWVACIFSCHAVCEREVAGILSTSRARVNAELPKDWEMFGLGKLLSEVAKHDLLPPQLIAEVRRVADARKPYGHWRPFTHEESIAQRVRVESGVTGHVDQRNLIERLTVRDATHAMLTTIRLYFGSYSLGGP